MDSSFNALTHESLLENGAKADVNISRPETQMPLLKGDKVYCGRKSKKHSSGLSWFPQRHVQVLAPKRVNGVLFGNGVFADTI